MRPVCFRLNPSLQPVVEETEVESSRGSAKGVVIGIAAVAAIAVAAIFVITLRKKEL